MKITTNWVTNLKIPEAKTKIDKANKQGLKDTVTDIANDAIKLSPVLTGNNARSIKFEVGPGQEIAKEEGTAAIYSTSGYGGYLETGTKRADPRPYIKPAFDMHKKELPENIKGHLA